MFEAFGDMISMNSDVQLRPGFEHNDDGGFSRNETLELGSVDSTVRNLDEMRAARQLAVILLKQDDMQEQFKDIPTVLQTCDISVYGMALWEFLVQQMRYKQMDKLWLLLAFISMQLSTPNVVHLLKENVLELSKVNRVKNLDLVCRNIIEASEFPLATALQLVSFMQACGDMDLSREEEFDGEAQDYYDIAQALVNLIESDHLLSILLETPTECLFPSFSSFLFFFFYIFSRSSNRLRHGDGVGT